MPPPGSEGGAYMEKGSLGGGGGHRSSHCGLQNRDPEGPGDEEEPVPHLRDRRPEQGQESLIGVAVSGIVGRRGKEARGDGERGAQSLRT